MKDIFKSTTIRTFVVQYSYIYLILIACMWQGAGHDALATYFQLLASSVALFLTICSRWPLRTSWSPKVFAMRTTTVTTLLHVFVQLMTILGLTLFYPEKEEFRWLIFVAMATVVLQAFINGIVVVTVLDHLERLRSAERWSWQ
ncbi:hypothetical protein ACS5PN_00045 [Roseateles sp. NT4]|uniref:hypothetical protein n=1 Tax=Roseateles sp. NT4 TaxID=3453715 RepID=UPI003EEA332A